MWYVRIGVLVMFIVACVLNVGANFYYNANHNFESPEMTCDQDVLELSVHCTNEDFFLGLKAQDADDGDLTDRIMIAGKSHFIETATCKMDYVVFDSDHNSATLTRKVRFIDYSSPKFVLTEPLVFSKGKNIRFLDNIKVEDVLDGDISSKIKVRSSNVSNYEVGIYPVQLEVVNSYGDKALVDLNVTVIDGSTDLPVKLKEYITYVGKGDPFDPYELIESVTSLQGYYLSAASVHISGNVDTTTTGCYQLVYSVDGSSPEQKTFLTVVVTGEDR